MTKISNSVGSMSRGKDLSRDDIRDLQDVFQRYPAIQAVYVFGSIGSGKTHQGSDLDLAIVSPSMTLKEKKLRLLTDLARRGFCDVDLVFLDTKDIVLKYEAIRQNHLIYATHNFDRGSMYSKVIRQYLDFEPYLKTQRKAYKRRIERGSTGSHSKAIEQTG
jgi:predicted nucleotidyltransferase